MDFQPLPVEFLLERGCCCGSECQNCPYLDDEGNRFVAGSEKMNEPVLEKKLEQPQSK